MNAPQSGQSNPRGEGRNQRSDANHHARLSSNKEVRDAVGWQQLLQACVHYLVRNGSVLARHEVKFMEKEIAKMAMAYRKALLYTASAAGFLVCGIFLFLNALVYILSVKMATWNAYLLVGAVSFLFGFISSGLAKNSVRKDSTRTNGIFSSMHETRAGNSFHTERV